MISSIDEFLTALQVSFEEDEFPRLILSAPLKRGDATVPRKQTVRPIELKGEIVLQWELQFVDRQTHLNLPFPESKARFIEFFGTFYREAYLFTGEAEFVLRNAKKGNKLTRRPGPKLKQVPQVQHNRFKNYLIPEGEPCQFLEALGIMTGSGRVKESRQKKFRQINRYLEIVNDIYPQLPDEGPLTVVDFGCGLSYLTFAVHYLLTFIHQRPVVLYGIDQRPDVIERCQLLAHDLNLHDLHFTTGKIEESASLGKVDLALSLHACDTATDAALTFAVHGNAHVILAVPCCQHEIFPQIANDDLQLILKHGILRERLAAMVTDALRAEALEAAGYKTQIMEFIDLEHTPKNILIRGVKRTGEHFLSSSRAYAGLKDQFNITCLQTDRLLQQESQLVADVSNASTHDLTSIAESHM